jgi:hypothetical protein
MDWEVSLKGDPADLDILSQSFSDPAFSISKLGDEFVLKSSQFDVMNGAREVRDRAKALLDLVNGAAMLAIGSRTPVAIGGVHRRHADGHRDVAMFAEIVGHCRVLASLTIAHLDGSTETFRPGDLIRDWVKVASTDKEVAKALSLLSTGPADWVNLYRVLEVVESDCGGIAGIKPERWATEKAIRLFKRTANSPGATGSDSRHGAQSTKPPPKPMPLPEARSLILAIVQAWLRAKVTS